MLKNVLNRIDKDVAASRNVRPLPRELAALMRRVLKAVEVDLETPIRGKVALSDAA